LFIGGTLGGLFGYFDHALFHHGGNELGSFALVGMGAVFAGIIRAPITSVLIIFEMTGSYELILPLMISNMTSFALARHFRPAPIYEALLEQDDIHLPHRGGLSHALEQLTIRSAMTNDPITIVATASVEEALQQVDNYDFSTYPVVDNKNSFLGLVTKVRLRRTSAEDGAGRRVSTIVKRAAPVEPEHTLVRAVVRMEKSGARQLAVVDRKRGNKLIGLLTMSDVVRAQAQVALEAEDRDRANIDVLSNSSSSP
jgi:CIC family chloride channel protein